MTLRPHGYTFVRGCALLETFHKAFERTTGLPLVRFTLRRINDSSFSFCLSFCSFGPRLGQADVNAASERGFTALLRAAEEGQSRIYQVTTTFVRRVMKGDDRTRTSTRDDQAGKRRGESSLLQS